MIDAGHPCAFPYSSIGPSSLNASDGVAVVAYTDSCDHYVLRDRAGRLDIVMSTEDPMPGEVGAALILFAAPSIGETGRVAFHVLYTLEGDFTTAILLPEPGSWAGAAGLALLAGLRRTRRTLQLRRK